MMKATILLLGAMGSVVVPTAAAEPAATREAPTTSLTAAARSATLKDIDYSSTCDAATTIEAWLKALTGRDARAINWTGGKCQLVNKLNPLDAGGSWCVQATISLIHPRDRKDKPIIEIYLEVPKAGHPGPAYEFRSFMMTRDGGWDYLRFRKDFEAQWRERFPLEASPPACED